MDKYCVWQLIDSTLLDLEKGQRAWMKALSDQAEMFPAPSGQRGIAWYSSSFQPCARSKVRVLKFFSSLTSYKVSDCSLTSQHLLYENNLVFPTLSYNNHSLKIAE